MVLAQTALPTEGNFTPAKMYLLIKSLEIKVNNLLREVDVLKNDLINKNNRFKKELKTFSEELVELKHQQDKFLLKLDLVIKELKKTAGAEDLASLQKYVDLWNPLNFVTQNDVVRIIENNLAEAQKLIRKNLYLRKASRRKRNKKNHRKRKRIKKHKRKVIHHAN